MRLSDVITILKENFELYESESWDNSGLQIGSTNADIKRVIIALDTDKNVVQEAVNTNTDLIITHHPFIFNSVKTIDLDTYNGSVMKSIITSGINLYSIHTNLDRAVYGVNFELAKKLGFDRYDILNVSCEEIDGTAKYGYGGVSDVADINICEYAEVVKSKLCCKNIKLYSDDLNKIVKKVAFCGGSGAEFISDAVKCKADVYITGDIKYHDAQSALKSGLSIIDAGHYYTECHVLHSIYECLKHIGKLDVSVYEKNSVSEIII